MKSFNRDGIEFVTGDWPLSPDRPTLVFIHGAGGSNALWKGQVEGLWGRANTVAIDLPGHGGSDGPGRKSVSEYAADVAGFIKKLGAPRPVPVGLSMGGAITQQLLLDFPDMFEAGILISTGAKLRVLPAIIETIEKDYNMFLNMLDQFSISPRTDPAEIAWLKEETAKQSPKVAADDFRACDAFDVRDRLGSIKARVLVLSGEDDKLTPPKYGAFLEQNIEGAKRVHIKDVGHMSPAEKPDEVNAAISSFLDEL